MMAQILIVDDDASWVCILVKCLRDAGHIPIVAPDGRSALQELGVPPDLILLDLGLPDIRGEELLRRFRSQPATAGIPVVVVAGATDVASVVAQSRMNGVAAVLRKPVSGDDVCRVVDAVLAMRTACRAATVGLPADRQRAKLILRLILEGSMPLVFHICRLLEVERTGEGQGAPTWLDMARLARREGLVDDKEVQVLQ
jgi:CheY-like chemotaxis protein